LDLPAAGKFGDPSWGIIYELSRTAT
jgi:hypothetical protein